MLDLITLLVQPFVKIRKEEWSKTLLMFFYFFITITCLYILKPVRSSIFLEKSGFENLPYVWISTVLILMVVVAVYVKFVNWVQKNVLLMGTVLFFVSNILTFWWLLGKEIPGLPSAFYIWVSIFSIMSVTQFWTLANDIFNSREAKRLFGFIGSGGILGGMCGGYITGLLVHLVGTVNLLIVAAIILCLSVVFIHVLWRSEHSRHEIESHQREEDKHKTKEERNKQNKELFKNIWRSKYLLLLLIMVCLAKLVSTLVEYQFNGIVQTSFLGVDKKTAFFGWFWGMLNTASFVIQFFLTSRVLRHLGIKVALLILPIGLLFGNMAILLNPGLWSAVFTMMYDGSLNYSLNQASKEVLYLPIVREIRYRVKPFIDMVGYRTAKGIGSLLILFMTQILIFDMRGLCLFTIALIIVWIMAAFVMKKEYLGELRNILSKERVQVSNISIHSSDIYLFNSAVDVFSKGQERDRLIALRALNVTFNPELNYYLKNIPGYDLVEAREEIQGYFNERQSVSSEIEGKEYIEEVEEFVNRVGLEDFEEYVSFVSSFRSDDDISNIRIFLVSKILAVQKAAFLLLVLYDKEFNYQKLPETLKHSLRVETPSSFRFICDEIEADKSSQDNEKIVQIQRKLSGFLEAEDSEKALSLIEEFLRDEEDFMNILDQFLNREKLPEHTVIKLTRILSMIPRQKSVEILQKSISRLEGNGRNNVLQALGKIRIESPTMDFDEKALLDEINAEVKEYGKVLRLLSIYLWHQSRSFSDALVAGDTFVIAQENRLAEIVQRLFLLLVILSEPEDIRAAYSGFSHSSDYVRSNALELLDNLLVPKLRYPILLLLDGEESLPRIREKGIKDFHWNQERANAYLRKAVLSNDTWSSVMSVVLMTKCNFREVLSECITKELYPNSMVRDLLLLTQTRLGLNV